MSGFARKHATTIVVAMMTALVAGNVLPALAHGNVHANSAHNADTVDGLHAVKSSATKQKRKGKLVATSPTTGLLPNNIIKKAPNSNKLDGLDSTDLAAASHEHDANDIADGPGSGLDADTLDGMSSDEFVQPAGDGHILIQADPTDWDISNVTGSLSESPGLGEDRLTSQSATGNATLFLNLDVPVALYGKDLSLDGVEVCYDAAAAHHIDEINYFQVFNSNGTPTFDKMVLDTTDRSDEACRFYDAEVSDPVLDGETAPVLEVKTVWTATTALLKLGRVTFMLEPTNTNTAPLSNTPPAPG